MVGGVGAAATELPTSEVMRFRITQHPLASVNSAQVQERLPAASPRLDGLPSLSASDRGLTPRPRKGEWRSGWTEKNDAETRWALCRRRLRPEITIGPAHVDAATAAVLRLVIAEHVATTVLPSP